MFRDSKGTPMASARQPSRPADRERLARALGDAMQRYQRSVQAFDDAVGRRLGLGPADLRCLDWLVDGPKSAGQLSAATGLRPAATTALIDRLAKRGLVRRRRSDTDRRTVLVEMTDLGQTQTWEAYGPLVRAGQPMLDELSDEQLDFMTDYLQRITALTDEHRQLLIERSPGRA
jgi:DNA-binding MarR family transcriptional regulator